MWALIKCGANGFNFHRGGQRIHQMSAARAAVKSHRHKARRLISIAVGQVQINFQRKITGCWIKNLVSILRKIYK